MFYYYPPIYVIQIIREILNYVDHHPLRKQVNFYLENYTSICFSLVQSGSPDFDASGLGGHDGSLHGPHQVLRVANQHLSGLTILICS